MKKIIASICALSVFFMIGCQQKKSNEDGHEDHNGMQLWESASCKAPKTCKLCGYTEGDVGEHYPKVGTCNTCNEFQNKELFDEIQTDVSTHAEKLSVAHSFLDEKTKTSNGDELIYASAIMAVSSDYDASKPALENTLNLCGDYEELSTVKRYIETALEYFPVAPTGTSMEESKNYIQNEKMYTLYILEALNALNQIS